jgi:hypothetical protein
MSQPYVQQRQTSISYQDYETGEVVDFVPTTTIDDLTDSGKKSPVIFVTFTSLAPMFQSIKFLKKEGTFRQTKDLATGFQGLREVQETALLKLRDRFVREKQERFLVLLPTGAGKTTIMALAPFMVGASSVLVVVPNLTLLQQTLTEFNKYFGTIELKAPKGSVSTHRFSHVFGKLAKVKLDIQLLVDSKSYTPRHVTITNAQHMIRTTKTKGTKLTPGQQRQQQQQKKTKSTGLPLYDRAAKYLKACQPDLIIFDEGHHSVADGWKLIWEAASAAASPDKTCKMLVVTATAMRANQKLSYITTYGLKTSDNVFVLTRDEARAAGYIKPTKYEPVDRDGLAFGTAAWRAKIMTAAIMKLRDIRASCPDLPWRILAHVDTINEAKALVHEVNQLSLDNNWKLHAAPITGPGKGIPANAKANDATKDRFACNAAFQVDNGGGELHTVEGPRVDVGTYVSVPGLATT